MYTVITTRKSYFRCGIEKESMLRSLNYSFMFHVSVQAVIDLIFSCYLFRTIYA
jgi:hypothetical protein